MRTESIQTFLGESLETWSLTVVTVSGQVHPDADTEM